MSWMVDAYLPNKMHKAVKTAVQLQSERLKDEAQAENADFLNKLDDNIKKIIKDQVKEQVEAQVSKILSKIEKLVKDQLESEVLIRSSNEARDPCWSDYTIRISKSNWLTLYDDDKRHPDDMRPLSYQRVEMMR
ncbi:hypothetical protein Tco_0470700 [Tanacetum coccineum]